MPDGPPLNPQQKTAFWKPAFVVLFFCALVGFAIYAVFNPGIFSTINNQFDTWIAAAGPFGGLVVVGLVVLHSIVFFPLELLAIAAGVAFGPVWGTLYVWVGSLLAASICFFLSRRLGRPFAERFLKPDQSAKLDRWMANQGAVTLLIGRLLPIVSFNLINYGAGLTAISWWTFLWTTAIGILPLTFLSVLFGAMMAELPLIWVLVMSACAIALVLFMHWLAKKRGWINS